jgi:hypothetical protein
MYNVFLIKRLVRVKFPSVVIFIDIIIIIIIIAIATRRPRLHSHQSDAPQYIKTLDSTGLEYNAIMDCLSPQKVGNFVLFTLSASRIYSIDDRMINEYGEVGGMRIGRGN